MVNDARSQEVEALGKEKGPHDAGLCCGGKITP